MSENDPQRLVTRIESDMRSAMKDRDTLKANTLRALLARFSNAEAVGLDAIASANTSDIAGARSGVGSTEVTRKNLSFTDRQHIIKDEIAEIQQAIQQLPEQNSYKTELKQKVDLLKQYLV